MMIKKYIIAVLICIALLPASAQNLLFQGHITFERKENMHKQLDEEGEWGESMKKRMPKYRTDLFQLSFNQHKTIYKLFQEEENTMIAQSFWRVAWNNAVLVDLSSRKLISEKSIYDRNYHIEDSLPGYTWKLTGEYREIAGHMCRKATTIIMDSLFVIAFYTDEIPVSGGPETIQGLPGMILGVVIPRLHYTIFATKVEYAVVKDQEFVTEPLKKSKPMDRKTLFAEIDAALNDWGKWGKKVYWRVVL